VTPNRIAPPGPWPRGAALKAGSRSHLLKSRQCGYTLSVPTSHKENSVIILGLILLVIGIIAHISILYTIGIILIVIGAILWILGATGRAVGGRKHYW
jgi:hypothetical protein